MQIGDSKKACSRSRLSFSFCIRKTKMFPSLVCSIVASVAELKRKYSKLNVRFSFSLWLIRLKST